MSIPNATPRTATIPPGFRRVESKLEGVTVFAPPPQTDPFPDARYFKCPNCGATTAFDPRAESVTCSNCGSVYVLAAQRVGSRADESEFTLDTLNSAPRGWGLTRRDLVCEKCGATTSVAPTELATTCPFCGSNRVAARTAVPDAFRPRYLIPFKVQREQCVALAREWLRRGWLYPRDLVRVAYGAQFAGIYLSFWTFRANVNARWRAEVGEERREQYFDMGDKQFKTRTRIDWEWKTGVVRVPFENLLGTGTRHIAPRLLKRLEPFQLDALVTYDPGYLAGWRAMSYEIELNTAWDAARAEMSEQARKSAYDDIDAKHIRNFSLNAGFDDETWRLILLPVYIAAYSFGGKTYQLVINGQTGKVAGDKPVDWKKVWAIVAALVIPGLAVAGLGLVLARQGAGSLFFIGGLLFIVGAVIAVVIVQQAMRAGEA